MPTTNYGWHIIDKKSEVVSPDNVNANTVAIDAQVKVNENAIKTVNDRVSNISLTWGAITGKPSTFPATPHGHGWGEISGKPSVFNPAPHGHNWVEISGTPSVYPPQQHNHSIANITGLQGEIDSLKSSVVSGKQTVANAINGRAGTSLGGGNSFQELANGVNSIPRTPFSSALSQQSIDTGVMASINCSSWGKCGVKDLPAYGYGWGNLGSHVFGVITVRKANCKIMLSADTEFYVTEVTSGIPHNNSLNLKVNGGGVAELNIPDRSFSVYMVMNPQKSVMRVSLYGAHTSGGSSNLVEHLKYFVE